MVEVSAAAVRPLQHKSGGEGGLVEVKRVPPAGSEYVDGAVTDNRRQDRMEGMGSDFFIYQAPTGAQLVGGQELAKSREISLIDSEMAGPIAMKLSEIDQGNSEHVLGKKKLEVE